MIEIYYYFALLYLILTAIQVYSFVISPKPERLLFSIFTLFMAACHYHMALFYSGRLLAQPYVYGIYPFMVTVTFSWLMIWFHYKMKTVKSSGYLLELVPPLAVLIASIPAILLTNDEKSFWAEKAFHIKDPLLMPSTTPLFIFFGYVVFIIYNVQNRISAHINTKNVFMDWKNNGYKLNAILAFYFSIIFILLFSAVNIIFAMLLQNPLKIFYILVPGSWLLLSVFLQIIDNFSPFKEFIKRYGKVPAEYSKTQLKNIDVDSLGSRLNSLMAVKKVYRNEKLSLQKLARMVEISPQQLSEYLNSVKKYGYREYINSFRIEEAKQLLTDKPEMNASLVGFEVGFPSVSGFYKIFKKYTGVSPADFRKKKHLALIA